MHKCHTHSFVNLCKVLSNQYQVAHRAAQTGCMRIIWLCSLGTARLPRHCSCH